MRVPGQVRQLLRDNRAVFLATSAALILVTAAYYLVLRGRDLDSSSVNDRILLFSLRNVNAVLVLAIAFVLIRNVFKLWVEHKHRKLGSRFKTKLVATYIALSLIPVLLLFAYATELMQGSLDNLFSSAPVEQLLDPGYNVSQALTSEIQDRRLYDARSVVAAVAEIPLEEPSHLPQLGRVLQRELSARQLDLLAVYQDTQFVHALLNPQSGRAELPEIASSFLLEVRREGTGAEVVQLPGVDERWILGAAASPPVESQARVIVVAGRILEADLAADTEKLLTAAQGIQKLKVQERDIRSIYLLLFLMVTLLILLVSSWVGLYLARQITVPIQALAEGTRRITSGDLQHRVQEAADDELGVLVDSFNRMTAELERNKRLLERSNAELTRTNLRLDEERDRIGALLQNLAAGVVSTDAAGKVRTLNGAAIDMLDIDPNEVVGQELDGADSPEALRLLFGTALRSEGAVHQQVRLALNGEWKTFEVKSTPQIDDNGDVAGRVLVLEDLTELIQAQKLATWNDAARRIAHEIKNPLTPIKLSAERVLLKHQSDDPTLDETLENAMEIIVREVENMKSMVDEFARFARMPRSQPTEVDLHKLVDETVTLYRDIKPGLEVKSDLPQARETASLDAEQLRSALVNLLDNAVAATAGPGRISVSAERQNGNLRIQVRDSGTGIPADAKEKLFLPYYSTKGRGTGLGLAIVHRIVTDHHGTIRVDDNQPKGTVFTIDLPQ